MRKTITVPEGVQILDYLTRLGILLPSFCDGSGVCGRCRIRITEGMLPVTPSDRSFLSEQALAGGWRLACCAVAGSPVRVEADVPDLPPRRQIRNAPHRFGIAVCQDAAALVDLTAVTVVQHCKGSVTDLLARFPDAAAGLETVIVMGEACLPPLPCPVRSLPQPEGTSPAEAVETGILAMFAKG